MICEWLTFLGHPVSSLTLQMSIAKLSRSVHSLPFFRSGAGRNSKVGAGAPVRSESGGIYPAQSAGTKFFLVVPLHFLALKVHLSFSWALSWWSVQFGQFIVCCSSTHCAPRAQPFVKLGSTCPPPPCPMESAPLYSDVFKALCRRSFALSTCELVSSLYWGTAIYTGWRWRHINDFIYVYRCCRYTQFCKSWT